MNCKHLKLLFACGLCLLISACDTAAKTSGDGEQKPVREAVSSLSAVPAVKTELRQDNSGNWSLWRAGQPFRIKGAGGEGSLQLLAQVGGNSTRTWGVDGNTQRRLDDAHAQGLTVAVGIWLEHSQKGFDYANTQKTQQQFDKVLAAVRDLHQHPAVMVWGLGNEMEGHEQGDNPDLWRHVDALAKAVKQIDPNHPTMTVVAEITEAKVAAIHKYCPHLDIIGINAYGGCASLPERYRQAGGTKPYIVTEFGPVGTWEIPRNNIDAILEPPSHQKAEMYRTAYEKLRADQQLCLGAYAFLWGNKQEGTATWFGMLLPDGQKTNAVDVMSELWNDGQAPANRVPQIIELVWQGINEVSPGAEVTAQMKVVDPERDQLQASWTLMKEADSYVTGGDFQNTPPSYLESIAQSDLTRCRVRLPKSPGLYRLYVEVRDAVGTATANLPIRVAEPTVDAGPPVELPFVVYREADEAKLFAPSGWMGGTESLGVTLDSSDQPHEGATCIKCEFRSGQGWGGVAWQNPEGDWGEQPGGQNFSGARRMRFWARGSQGGETVKVGFGLLGREKPFYDTAKMEIEIRLETTWKSYEIDISQANLSRIKTPFCWVVAPTGQPLTFYLDDIIVE